MTANKNETSGAFLNSTSQSFYNKFSDKEFSTLLCLRYNLDLELYLLTLIAHVKEKTKSQVTCNQNSLTRKVFTFATRATVMDAQQLFTMLFKMSLS